MFDYGPSFTLLIKLRTFLIDTVDRQQFVVGERLDAMLVAHDSTRLPRPISQSVVDALSQKKMIVTSTIVSVE